MKIISIIIVFLIPFTFLMAQKRGKKLPNNEDIETTKQETISSQVQTIRMLIDIENMIEEMNTTDETEIIQKSINMDTESLVERFRQLQMLKQMQIEYLEAKEEEINLLLLKFNEIERKSKMANSN